MIDAFLNRLRALGVPKNELHNILGVSRSSLSEWRRGIKQVPPYITYSIQAHNMLSDAQLIDLLIDRGEV